jgi:hypothetical protein
MKELKLLRLNEPNMSKNEYQERMQMIMYRLDDTKQEL